MTPVVACHQEWSGRSPLSEALTEALMRMVYRGGKNDDQINFRKQPPEKKILRVGNW